MLTANATFFESASAATAAVQALNIEFMIFTKVNSTAPLTLLHTNVLDSGDPGFYFFGWTYLYDWVVGNREAVAFQGDAGNLTILTDLELPLLQQARTWELSQDFAQYCRAGVWYVTFVMLFVAAIACGYMVAARGHFEGLNMLELSRVGGIVWVGRPLLFLRSLTALCLLSTATFNLQTTGYISYFAAVPTPWYKTWLASSEATWLVSVVNDIALVFTKEYSVYYVTPNSALVWFVVAVLAYSAPVKAHVALHHDCDIAEMNLQVVCTSGDIAIGQITRLVMLAIIVVACNMVCYGVARTVVRKPHCYVKSLLLSSGAKYLFLHSGRIFDDVYYLDRASAALAGVLTYRRGQTMYALDIKLWRVFAIPLSLANKNNPTLDAALPLLN
ncbi:hypothetical protein ACHHYP_00224 [Achlya hypogyna]|uniref:Transmembrane protein n=1 Tax=Achlya hypogyna TaxID=1202772 RepID=A0A1V9ZB69_ACHHY|nr:hypothetical protein ACHHYP_00224 [Achlya hypogyna]